jgi:hypothetical protein
MMDRAARFETMSARIPYLVTGSISAIAHGEPRFTNDIDVVVHLRADAVREFCGSFPFPDYYVSEDAAREAVAARRSFNIIHPASGLRSQFGRICRLRPAPDYEASFDSPEDLIINGILKISGERLDRGYLESWVRRLGLEEPWKDVQGGRRAP